MKISALVLTALVATLPVIAVKLPSAAARSPLQAAMMALASAALWAISALSLTPILHPKHPEGTLSRGLELTSFRY